MASNENAKFRSLIRKINWYPPFLGMGISVKSFSDDFTRFDVVLKQRFYNRNLFGTHFGGSLFTMSDPFYVFIVTMNFGKHYIVWDKSAAIDYLKPARGTVTGIFKVDQQRLKEMRAQVDAEGKSTFDFTTDLTDENDVAVARVQKTVYVRTKQPRSTERRT